MNPLLRLVPLVDARCQSRNIVAPKRFSSDGEVVLYQLGMLGKKCLA